MWLSAHSILIFSLLMCANVEPRRHFNLEIHSAECRNFTALTETYKCDLYKVSSNLYVFNSRVVFRQDLQQHFEVSVVVDVQQKYSKVRVRLVDLHLDGCHSLHALFENTPLRYMVAELRRTGNFSSTCPLKADTLYNVNNYSVTPSMLPPYAPNLNFTFTVNFYNENVRFADINVLGAIVPK